MIEVVPSYLVVFICVQKGVWCLFFMQEEHAKASTVAIPTSAKDIVIEPQAPINKKSQAKALTPPVSLKNFFHVQPKPSETVDSERTDKQSDEKTTLEQHASEGQAKWQGQTSPDETVGQFYCCTYNSCYCRTINEQGSVASGEE